MSKYSKHDRKPYRVETVRPDGAKFSRTYPNAQRAWRAYLQTKKPSARRPPGTECRMMLDTKTMEFHVWT